MIEERKLEKIRAEGLKEVREIEEMSDGTLVEAFEHLIRNGAGPGFRRVVFMKREMLKRMEKGWNTEKEEGKDGI